MSKKTFTSSYDNFLVQKGNNPKSEVRKKVNKVMTTIVTELETLEKIRSIAYWERLKISQVMNEAIKEYIKKYESKKGVIESPSNNNN